MLMESKCLLGLYCRHRGLPASSNPSRWIICGQGLQYLFQVGQGGRYQSCGSMPVPSQCCFSGISFLFLGGTFRVMGMIREGTMIPSCPSDATAQVAAFAPSVISGPILRRYGHSYDISAAGYLVPHSRPSAVEWKTRLRDHCTNDGSPVSKDPRVEFCLHLTASP